MKPITFVTLAVTAATALTLAGPVLAQSATEEDSAARAEIEEVIEV